MESVTDRWILTWVLKQQFSILNFHYQELFISNSTSHNPLLLNILLMIMLLFGIFLFFISPNVLVLQFTHALFNWFVHRSFETEHKSFEMFHWFEFLQFDSKPQIALINNIIITKTTKIFRSTINRVGYYKLQYKVVILQWKCFSSLIFF